MAKAGQGDLEGLTASLPKRSRGLPPVERWDPPFCGDIDMRIAADGTWYYQKTPIGRPALVQLFAGILRREDDKYFLVTPVEKVGLVVEEVPFLAIELRFEVTATGGLKHYLHVRRELWAKVTRALFYDLVELGEEREQNGKTMYGVVSSGEFFAMAEASAVREFA